MEKRDGRQGGQVGAGAAPAAGRTSLAAALLVLLFALLLAGPGSCSPAIAVAHGDGLELLDAAASPAVLLRRVRLGGPSAVSAVAADGRGRLFLADYAPGLPAAIYEVAADGEGTPRRLPLPSGGASPVLVGGMAAVASKGRTRLYLSDPKSEVVVGMRAVGDAVTRDVIVPYIRKKPKRLVYDPCSKRLFWTVKGSGVSSIDTSVDLETYETVVSHLVDPRALAVRKGRLFWMDAVSRVSISVESADLSGGDIKTVCQLRGHDPNDMVADGEGNIFWTDGKNMALWTMNIWDQGSDCLPKLVKKFASSRPLALTFVGLDGCDETQRNESSSTSKCDGFCLGGGECSVGDNGVPKCKCPTGLRGSRCEDFQVVDVIGLSEPSTKTPDKWQIWLLILAVILGASTILVIVVTCIKWWLGGKVQQGVDGGPNKHSPVVIVRARGSRAKKYTGGCDNSAAVTSDSNAGEKVLVDLEDCCLMTICEKPCVELSSQQSPRKGVLSRSKAVLCSPHKTPLWEFNEPHDSKTLLTEDGLSGIRDEL